MLNVSKFRIFVFVIAETEHIFDKNAMLFYSLKKTLIVQNETYEGLCVLELSRRLNSIKPSRAISRVSCLYRTDVSRTISVIIIRGWPEISSKYDGLFILLRKFYNSAKIGCLGIPSYTGGSSSNDYPH